MPARPTETGNQLWLSRGSLLRRLLTNVLLEDVTILERESEPTVIALLNRTDIDRELTLRMALANKISIQSIETIHEDKEIWDTLCRTDAMAATWDNVRRYTDLCCVDSLQDPIIAYLKRPDNAQSLASHSVDIKQTNILHQILACKELGLDIVKLLLKAAPKYFEIGNLPEVCESYLAFAIENKWVPFTTDNFLDIKNRCIHKLGLFVVNNSRVFFKEIENLTIDGIALHEVLNAAIKKSAKKQIATKSLNRTPFEHMEYCADDLCDMLSSNALFGETLPTDTLRDILVECTDNDIRIDLLTRFSEKFEKNVIADVLEASDDPFCQIAQNGRRPALINNERNQRLANALNDTGYISSATDEGDKIRINTHKGGPKSEEE